MIIETPVLLTGKVNLKKPLHEVFNKSAEVNEYQLTIRVPLNTQDKLEKEFLNKVNSLSNSVIEAELNANKVKYPNKEFFKDVFTTIIDPSSPSFKENYSTSILSKGDFSIRLRIKCKKDSPRLKSYQAVSMVDSKVLPINTDEKLDLFTEGCAVKAYIKILSYTNPKNRVGASGHLVGLQYIGPGEPFMPEKIDFTPFEVVLGDVKDSNIQQFI